MPAVNEKEYRTARGRAARAFHELRVRTGSDRAVAYGLGGRIWLGATAPVTTLLIAFRFSGALQGFYYTFASLLALQVFLEMGLGLVLTQFASHEWARLSVCEQSGRIIGDSVALARLASILRFGVRWYAVAGVLAACGIGAGGLAFFPGSGSGIDWKPQWLALCAAAGVSLILTPLWSVLEGCNRIADVYLYRLVNSIVQSLSTWCAILLGLELWTGAVAATIGIAWGIFYLSARHRTFLYEIWRSYPGPHVTCRAELLQMQWRVAVSWASNYFCGSLFTPALFHFRGAAAAGQMGMTWTLVSGIAVVASTWVTTKLPRFGALVAQRKFAQLDALVLRVGSVCLFVTLCGGSLLLAGVWFLQNSGLKIATRVLPPLPTAYLIAAVTLNAATIPLSGYLRAHKREPLATISFLTGVFVGAATLMLARRDGAAGIALGYLAVTSFFAVPAVVVIFLHCRVAWHVPNGREDAS